MFYARKNNKNSKPVPAKDSLYTYICEDGYSYASFPEKICEGYEEIPEELFLEKTKDLYQESTEWGASGFPVVQLSNESRYGLVMLSEKLGDDSKVKVPTAEQLKAAYDIACETKETVNEIKDVIQNGGQIVTGLKDGSVTTPKLADGAVTNIKIADDSISEEKLKNNCINNSKIQSGSINSDKLQKDCVTNTKLLNDCVTTEKIKDNSISENKLQNNCINNSKIQSGSINSDKLQKDCVTNTKLLNGCITKEKLSKELLNSINSNGSMEIPDNSITGNKIKDGAITNSKLDNSSINANKLQNSCVTKVKLAQEVLNLINTSSNIDIPDNSITAKKIKNVQYLSKHVVIGEEANVKRTDNTEVSQEYSCTALGSKATASGLWSTALGVSAKASNTNSTALGGWANAYHEHSTSVGFRVSTTASNQVMLGNYDATPYAHRSLVITSDKRDKTDIKDIEYNSLEFLNKLNPKQYRMDCRSNYKRDEEISKEEYESLDEYTKKSHTTIYKIYELENGFRYINYSNYDDEKVKKDSDRYKPIFKTKDIFLSKEIAETELRKKLRKDGIENKEYFEEKEVGEIILKEVFLESDGSMAGERYHNGFLAQEVENVAKSMNFDFAGVKYLAHNGDGEDMYGIAYEEFIAPIIASIQELSRYNENLKKENEDLKNRIEALEKLHQV